MCLSVLFTELSRVHLTSQTSKVPVIFAMDLRCQKKNWEEKRRPFTCSNNEPRNWRYCWIIDELCAVVPFTMGKYGERCLILCLYVLSTQNSVIVRPTFAQNSVIVRPTWCDAFYSCFKKQMWAKYDAPMWAKPEGLKFDNLESGRVVMLDVEAMVERLTSEGTFLETD